MSALIIGFVCVALAIYILIRNNLVYRERERVVEMILSINQREFDRGMYQYWAGRWFEYDKISYYEMVFSLRPVKNFFKDAEFLKEKFPMN